MPKTEEQFRQMRDDMRSRILRESSLYFAKNGFGDTKIGDLAKHIGIGQGTIYLYFKSKEELFEEIRRNADNSIEVKKIRALAKLPVSATSKIEKISEEVIKCLDDEEYAVKITIYTQLLLEQDSGLYKSDMYEALAGIIKKGQKAGKVRKGDPLMLADLYWGTVYLYALKKLFIKEFRMIDKATLCHLLEV
ncbi:MAG: TetR/AcrR family transcriptional regulator [Lachnospiraceae bacterium]|nr:TetR/AcrR family transcriptional regulator [Lachnospiraceae bacterium]MBO7530275.1 TetR/AcrR family transcriptional regulator [Lachnospiraceae bacterium]MBP5252195.1 TetR/AcrR family transcriptional regulator [Lachnospiraceae bacterium]MBP5702403.1 TetR/AcrR family transcriptional regulator [Lachnospiraceae bacterium]MBP5762055.1 TetR/AcrR family transcriptional regulator [Lachnospiraceae bacterium]